VDWIGPAQDRDKWSALVNAVMNLRFHKMQGNRPLGIPRRRLVHNIKMELVEVGWGDVDWIGLAQDRNKWKSSCEFGYEPSGSIKCWETIGWPNN
jgi:hypothetical protein